MLVNKRLKPNLSHRSSIRVLISGLFFLVCSTWVLATSIVKVGIDPFPPYAVKNEDGNFSGLNVEMMEIMNDFQSQYKFVHFITSATRRFDHFTLKHFDMYMSDQLSWGWQGYPIESTEAYLHDGEKYVALAKSGRGQEYFNDLEGKTFAGVLGYHYGLANFEYDPQLLKEKYRMQLSSTNKGNLLKVVHQRVDIAIVNQAYISRWLSLYPQYKDKLLISDIWDQKYHLKMIIRKGVSPSAKELNELIVQMKAAGVLTPLWKKYGISPAK